ncbi:MAG: hypothetical protein ACRDCB_13255 [Clostridium sp.]
MKNGFVYETKDDYYCIGCNIFTKCLDSRIIKYYEEIKSGNVEKYKFNKIIKLCNLQKEHSVNYSNTKNKIKDFINNLDKNEKIHLELQLKNFERLCRNYLMK